MNLNNNRRYKQTASYQEQQQSVDKYFSTEAAYWKSIYHDTDLMSRIYQLRRDVILKIIDDLRLPSDAYLLEVGCGAGLTTTELAKRGYKVEATDTVQEMLDLTKDHVTNARVGSLVKTSIGDVNNLHFRDNTFDVVLAVGVLPWLAYPTTAIKEMARVAKNECYIILTADNRYRLNHILDPRFNPLLKALRILVKKILYNLGLMKPNSDGARNYMHTIKEIHQFIAPYNLKPLNDCTLGFGPFSILGKTIFPDSLGVKVHQTLQYLANQNFPWLRSTGSHYVIVVQKNSSRNR